MSSPRKRGSSNLKALDPGYRAYVLCTSADSGMTFLDILFKFERNLSCGLPLEFILAKAETGMTKTSGKYNN